MTVCHEMNISLHANNLEKKVHFERCSSLFATLPPPKFVKVMMPPKFDSLIDTENNDKLYRLSATKVELVEH